MVLMHSVVSSVRGVADDSRRKKQIKTTLDQDIIKRLGVGTAMLLVFFFFFFKFVVNPLPRVLSYHTFPQISVGSAHLQPAAWCSGEVSALQNYYFLILKNKKKCCNVCF